MRCSQTTGVHERLSVLKGNDLSFNFKVSGQGQELIVTYTGVVEGNNAVKGTVTLGELGEGTFTGKKAD